MNQSLSCQIEVRGLLEHSWVQGFDGLTLDPLPKGSRRPTAQLPVRPMSAIGG